MKKKLKLNLDDLHVESFETTAPTGPRGTVHGASGVLEASCLWGNCCFPETQSCGCPLGHTQLPCDQEHTGWTSCPTQIDETCAAATCIITCGDCDHSAYDATVCACGTSGEPCYQC